MTKSSKALLASVCLHGLVIGGYCVLVNYEPPVKLTPPSIQVTLAKLGTPRDKTLLPRVEKKSTSPLDMLKKRFGKASNEGQEQGSALGSSLTSELASSYELQVLEILRSNYEIPRIISDREAKSLALWVRLWIAANGDLLRIKIQQASNNSRFDQAVLEGAHKIPSFGAPPLQLARKYRTEGLLIQFCPLECS